MTDFVSKVGQIIDPDTGQIHLIWPPIGEFNVIYQHIKNMFPTDAQKCMAFDVLTKWMEETSIEVAQYNPTTARWDALISTEELEWLTNHDNN